MKYIIAAWAAVISAATIIPTAVLSFNHSLYDSHATSYIATQLILLVCSLLIVYAFYQFSKEQKNDLLKKTALTLIPINILTSTLNILFISDKISLTLIHQISLNVIFGILLCIFGIALLNTSVKLARTAGRIYIIAGIFNAMIILLPIVPIMLTVASFIEIALFYSLNSRLKSRKRT